MLAAGGVADNDKQDADDLLASECSGEEDEEEKLQIVDLVIFYGCFVTLFTREIFIFIRLSRFA